MYAFDSTRDLRIHHQAWGYAFQSQDGVQVAVGGLNATPKVRVQFDMVWLRGVGYPIWDIQCVGYPKSFRIASVAKLVAIQHMYAFDSTRDLRVHHQAWGYAFQSQDVIQVAVGCLDAAPKVRVQFDMVWKRGPSDAFHDYIVHVGNLPPGPVRMHFPGGSECQSMKYL